jgi:hypothetical protein
MKRLMLILPAAVLLLSGCAVYEPGPVYPAGYYTPPRVSYGYPVYAPPPVYGGVWIESHRGYRGYRGHRGGYRGDHWGGYRGYGKHWR